MVETIGNDAFEIRRANGFCASRFADTIAAARGDRDTPRPRRTGAADGNLQNPYCSAEWAGAAQQPQTDVSSTDGRPSRNIYSSKTASG